MTRPASAPEPAERRGKIGLFLWYWLPVIAYVGLIFGASSIHGRDVPVFFPYMDKLEHLTEYALFGLLLGRAFRFAVGGQRGRRWALGTVLLGAIVGALDELYQRSTPGRQSDIRDWLTDLTALLIAVLLTQYVKIHPIRRRRAAESSAATSAAAEAPEERAR
mgnify:CR=1 FL=1